MFKPDDVNLDRVLGQLGELSHDGGQPLGGVTRYTFSPEHLQATRRVAGWMSAAGLDVAFDRWGNMLGRVGNADGMILSGSHLDSVPNGGNYDGVLGVVSALEAVTLILEQDIPVSKALGVVSFIEEEGARFHGLMGSKLATGMLDDAEIAQLQDAEGRRYLDILEAASSELSLRDLDFASDVTAFLELHIEQGKRLEQANIPIGVVTSIAGPTFRQATFTGKADHAGATEYEDRRDSLLAAAEFIVALRETAVRRFAGRGHMTVGRLNVRPNVTNVVAGETVFSIDYRSADANTAVEMDAAVVKLLDVTAEKHRVSLETSIMHRTAPTPASIPIQTALREGADSAGVSHTDLVSWAAHDAMNMASRCDMGMVFVPCRDGRSHTPEEYVNPEHIAIGIAVLANALVQLSQ